MRIQGDLATYEFSDLLQWLAQGKKTGILTVSDGGVEYKLGFDHGRIEMSSSSDPEKSLARYLYGKGVIDEATLARAERLRQATHMMSGQVLVTLGAVSEVQLSLALRDSTEEILCELLTWDQGTFEFQGGERSDTARGPISLEVTKLLLESMHRLDQRQQGDEPEPVAAFAIDEPTEPTPPPDATKVIAGLAPAEVMDPASTVEPAVDPPAESVEELARDVTPPYVVVSQSPGPVRRLAPYILVVALSLTAASFYLANRQASAQPVETAGDPILFTQTSVPVQPPAEPVVDLSAAVTARPARTVPVDAGESPSERALRRQYEEELAGLRQELEEARRLTQDEAREPAAPPSVSAVRTSVATPTVAGPVPRAATPEPTPAESVSAPPPAKPRVQDSQPLTPVATPPEPAPAGTATEAGASFDFVNPALVARPTARYPVAARRHRLGATVTVRVLIGTDGRVEQVERVGAKAGMGFDHAAEHAALGSTWEPGTRAGVPVPMWAELRFEFKP